MTTFLSHYLESHWRDIANHLRNGSPEDICPEILDDADCSFNRGRRVLDLFFGEQNSLVDTCVILYGALTCAESLKFYLGKTNLLFYRPKTSHSRESVESFLDGTPNPSRPLLLFDVDMVSGDTLRETANFFWNLGYDRGKMSAYLDIGAHNGMETITSVKLAGPIIKDLHYLLENYGGKLK